MARPAAAVRITAVGVGLAYSAALALSGVHLDTVMKKVLAYLPLAAGAALASWDGLVWRLRHVHRFLRRPRIDGTWIVTLTPTEESHIPEGGNRGPIHAYMIVRQTYWGLAIRQYSAESTSDLRTHFWAPGAEGGPQDLVFTYENIPHQTVQHRSSRHFGTCELDPTTRLPTEMTGYYFTDRYTKGDIVLRLHDRSTGHASFGAVTEHISGRARQNERRKP
jgi:hypothetical protein